MQEQKKSYRHILKATSLFGGVQVIQILANLVRGKFIAILLGPTGIGISNLLGSSTTMISNITGLGLNFSAIRDISIAAESNDIDRISTTIIVFRRWIWFTGLMGVLVTLAFAPFLSKLAFGNNEYTWAFLLLSSTLLLTALNLGNITILQGMRRLRDIAKSSVIGSVVGLFTTIPLYYFYGIKGIVPAIILASISLFFTSTYFVNKLVFKPEKVTYKQTLSDGQDMVKLGFLMMISVFLGALVTTLVNAFIRYKGGLSDVGLYQAGLSISNQFIGLVFVAMGTDYFPRLSGISADNIKVREMVNQQGEIVVLIAAPLLIALLVTAPLIIQILLSSAFSPIIVFIRWLSIGMLFKAASYSIGYIAFAKGDKKVFFIVEGVMGNLMTLIFNVVAYNFWGLKGMGVSFLVSFIFYFIAILIITNRLYSFKISKPFIRIFIFFVLLCVTTFILTFVLTQIMVYVAGLILILISVIFSVKELDSRIGLKSLILARFKE